VSRVWRHPRAVARLAAIAIWCAACARLQSTAGLRRWARGAARVMGIDVRVAGPLPPPGALIVANHLGFLDIIVLASVMDTVFLAKSEVAAWPGIGRLTARAGTLFIRRSDFRDVRRVKARIEATLREQRRVTYFPEGTSTDGRSVLPFRSGLLQAAIDGAQPVHTASLYFSSADAADTTFCWWGDQQLWGALYRVCGVRRITARLHFEEPDWRGVPRKPLARALREVVARRVTGLREEGAASLSRTGPRGRRTAGQTEPPQAHA